jgi:hypothetical protein
LTDAVGFIVAIVLLLVVCVKLVRNSRQVTVVTHETVVPPQKAHY